MISRKTAEEIHSVLIKRFGGTDGTRDASALVSALLRPFQTFENVDLYPDLPSRAAALIESVITNHPFIDGNKRTAYILMRLFLIYNKADINASQQEKFEFVMSIAKGERRYDEIVQWLTSYIVYQNV